MRVLLLEKKIYERFVIQEKIPEFVRLVYANTIKETLSLYESEETRVILIGPSISSKYHAKIIDIFKNYNATESLIFFSRNRDLGKSILAYKSFKGYFVYISKKKDETRNVIRKVLSKRINFSKESKKFIDDENNEIKLFVGSSEKVDAIKKLAQRYAYFSDPILIHGETGTGKEIIANLIHKISKRKDYVFHTINAGNISYELSLSEFFGATTGAYTGARSRCGMFEYADKGTMFIDEIGELQLQIQSELLRVLQDGSVRRIGSNQVKHVNFRLISATNKDLIEEIKNKRFRLDLFHRINTFEIFIPPLRERKEDIIDLLSHFSNELKKEKPEIDFEITSSFIDKLIEYDWPGNVRELRNVFRRAVFSSDKEILTADSIRFNKIKL